MKNKNYKMELSQVLSMEMPSSTGWADNTVLPNDDIAHLHDCLELAVNGGYEQPGECLSPDTDASIENVTSWLDELGDVDIPDVPTDEVYMILKGEIFCDSFCYDACTDEIIVDNRVSHSAPIEVNLNPGKSPTRRKQRIIPLRETITDDAVHHRFMSSGSPPEYEFKQESDGSEDDIQMLDVVFAGSGSPRSPVHLMRSGYDEKKEETKARRKRGLSHVEKRDRKKESNRNASYRYRQRKKMEKDEFLLHANTVKEQLEIMRNNYFQTAEELIRYIKHANLIRTVKDECCQLMLE